MNRIKEFIKKIDESIIFITGIAIFAGMAIGYWRIGDINIGQLLEVLIVVSLVAVTMIYARDTKKIAKSTQEQSEELKRQRFYMTTPVVLPDCSTMKFYGATNLNVVLQNFGQGLALNIGITIVADELEAVLDAWETGKRKVSTRGGFDLTELVAGNDTKENSEYIKLELHKGEHFMLIVECHDIYENDIATLRGYMVMGDDPEYTSLALVGTFGARKIKHRIRPWP